MQKNLKLKLWKMLFSLFYLMKMENTEYLSVFSPNAGKCGTNADQNNSEYGHKVCSRNIQLPILPQNFKFSLESISLKFNGNTVAKFTWHCMQQNNYQLFIVKSRITEIFAGLAWVLILMIWFSLEYFPNNFWSIYSIHSAMLLLKHLLQQGLL